MEEIQFMSRDSIDMYYLVVGMLSILGIQFCITFFTSICEDRLIHSFRVRRNQERELRGRRRADDAIEGDSYYGEALKKYIKSYLKLIWHFPEQATHAREQEIYWLLFQVSKGDPSFERLERKFLKRATPQKEIEQLINQSYFKSIQSKQTHNVSK
jgi:hypothetical protein